MGRGALNSLADSVRTPIALLGALAPGHRASMLVRRTQNVIFRAHHIIAGTIEAKHNDAARKE